MARFISLLATALLAVACSSNDDNGTDSTIDDASPPLQDSGSTPAPDKDIDPDIGSDIEPDIGPDVGADVGGPSDLSVTFTDGGCLDFASASQTCGYKSDKTVCQQAIKCGLSDSLSQCQINCEMGTTTANCYSADDVTCLLDAVAKESCDDLKACGWIL